jgi:hypothetical protein
MDCGSQGKKRFVSTERESFGDPVIAKTILSLFFKTINIKGESERLGEKVKAGAHPGIRSRGKLISNFGQNSKISFCRFNRR